MENLPRPAAIFAAIVTIVLGIAWGFAEYDMIPVESNIFEPILTVFGALTVIAGLFDFSSNKSDEKEQPGNREILIDVVQNNWIDGFLKDALRDAQIQVPIETAPERVERISSYELPVNLVLNDGNSRDNIKHTPDILLKTFHDTGEQLLILGEPGSGKTVLLLQLAERLLEEAKQDNPIPVVFTLSSWAEKRESIHDWLIERLKIDYGVSKKLAESWIAGDSIIYLLDGFDEVAEEHREACLNELNKFITVERQLVICSRIKEYETLTKSLKTQFAIEVQALPEEEFKQLLRNNIPMVANDIISFIDEDTEVKKEINKPLFINILINTYAESDQFLVEDVQGEAIDKVRQMIIAPYISRQLRNVNNPPYSNENTRRYLSWIASNLVKREQTTFYVEMLQPEWLITSNINSELSRTNRLIIELIRGRRGINLERKLLWSNQEARRGLKLGAILGVVFGVLGGLLISLLVDRNLALLFGIVLAISGTLTFGVAFGLSLGISGKSTISQRTYFNRGLQETYLLGLIVCAIFIFIFGIIGGLSGLQEALMLGLLIGIPLGLGGGLSDVSKHIVLRLMLQNKNLAPRRFDKFLLYTIDRRLMRRVGGSAIFIHRYILEYFADYWDKHYAPEFSEK